MQNIATTTVQTRVRIGRQAASVIADLRHALSVEWVGNKGQLTAMVGDAAAAVGDAAAAVGDAAASPPHRNVHIVNVTANVQQVVSHVGEDERRLRVCTH